MALTDEEEVFNLALGTVGEFQIEDTTESRALKPYLLCSRFYDLAREMILKRHRWDEATEFVVILEDSTKPLFTYASKFSVPSDSLQVDSISRKNLDGSPGRGDIMPWSVAGDFILTNNQESPGSWQADRDYVAGQYINDTVIAWVSGTVYLINQVISFGGTSYSAVSGHTATAGNRPDVDDGTIWTNRGSISESTYLCNVANTSTTSTRPNAQTTTTTWTSQGDAFNILYVTYTKKLTDVDKFTPLLKNVIVVQLASMIVTGLHNDLKAKTALINEIEQLLLPQARSMDSMQGKPNPIFSSRKVRSRWWGWVR